VDLTETAYVGVDWIPPDEDRSQWHAVMNTALSLRVHTKLEISLLAE
jgi:hypothetical protein